MLLYKGLLFYPVKQFVTPYAKFIPELPISISEYGCMVKGTYDQLANALFPVRDQPEPQSYQSSYSGANPSSGFRPNRFQPGVPIPQTPPMPPQPDTIETDFVTLTSPCTVVYSLVSKVSKRSHSGFTDLAGFSTNIAQYQEFELEYGVSLGYSPLEVVKQFYKVEQVKVIDLFKYFEQFPVRKELVKFSDYELDIEQKKIREILHDPIRNNLLRDLEHDFKLL